MGTKASYEPEKTALPGFHIFVLTGNETITEEVAKRAHFDLQWRQALPGVTPEASLSFTLTIEEPAGGAAMEFWDFRYEDAQRTKTTAFAFASTQPSRFFKYEPGHILVHDGLDLHAIARGLVKSPSGFRITLQGHGVLLPDGWLLYW